MQNRPHLALLPLMVASFLVLSATPSSAEPAPAHIQLEAEPTSLDPHKIDALEDYRLAVDLFEGLTTYSATDTVLPGAATSRLVGGA